MESKDIAIITAIVAASAFSLYRRYMKNKQRIKSGSPSGTKTPESSFPTVRDDDYEPYSKK